MSMALKTIFSSLSGGLFKEVRKFVDDIHTSKEEKLTIASKIKQVELEFEQKSNEFELEFEKQLTERQRNDTTSDSWLPKNIRPLTLIFLLGGFIIFTVLEGSIQKFKIDSAIIETFKTWGALALTFYFGSRGVEKISKIRTKI